MLKQNLSLIAVAFLFGGCAATFQPPLLPPNNPANPQTREGVKHPVSHLLVADSLARQADVRLSENTSAHSDNEPMNMAMEHDMSSMKGMQPMDGMKMDSQQKKSTVGKAYYTCVMHPQIQQGKPGGCPICGMTLVKKEGDKQ